MTALELRGVSKVYGDGAAEVAGAADVDLTVEPRRARRGDGPERIGQEHAAHDRRQRSRSRRAGEVLVAGHDRGGDCRATTGRRCADGRSASCSRTSTSSPGSPRRRTSSLPLELDGMPAGAGPRRWRSRRSTSSASSTGPTVPRRPLRRRAPAGRDRPGRRRRADLLLADEPTGALDSVNGEGVMRLVRAACQRGVAGVVVTHDAQLASWADRIVFLRDGRIVDQTLPAPGRRSLLATQRRDERARRRPVRRGAPSIRWSLRLLRREWRQQLARHRRCSLSPWRRRCSRPRPPYNVGRRPDGRVRQRDHRITIDRGDPASSQTVRRRRQVVLRRRSRSSAHRRSPIPGSAEAARRFARRIPRAARRADARRSSTGASPAAAAEVALTDGPASMFDAATGRHRRARRSHATVVGIVRNPSTSTTSSRSTRPTPPTGSTTSSPDPHRRRQARRVPPARHPDGPSSAWRNEATASSGPPHSLMLVAATLAMLLVSLVAGAAFTVIAQRRQRQLGMLAAIGATAEPHQARHARRRRRRRRCWPPSSASSSGSARGRFRAARSRRRPGTRSTRRTSHGGSSPPPSASRWRRRWRRRGGRRAPRRVSRS